MELSVIYSCVVCMFLLHCFCSIIIYLTQPKPKSDPTRPISINCWPEPGPTSQAFLGWARAEIESSSSKHHSAGVQPHRAASMALDLWSCFISQTSTESKCKTILLINCLTIIKVKAEAANHYSGQEQNVSNKPAAFVIMISFLNINVLG